MRIAEYSINPTQQDLAWPKRQGDLGPGDYGLIVVGYDDDGMIPAWVEILYRQDEDCRVRVHTATTSEETDLNIDRIAPISSVEFRAARAYGWSRHDLRTNLKLGAFFDARDDGEFYPSEYGLQPTKFSVDIAGAGR